MGVDISESGTCGLSFHLHGVQEPKDVIYLSHTYGFFEYRIQHGAPCAINAHAEAVGEAQDPELAFPEV